MSSFREKRDRAERLEKWAETAMFALLKASPSDHSGAVIAAWAIAVSMEDRRNEVVGYLYDLEPQDPTEPPGSKGEGR